MTKKHQGVKLLTSEQSLALMEEKARKKTEEEEANENENEIEEKRKQNMKR